LSSALVREKKRGGERMRAELSKLGTGTWLLTLFFDGHLSIEKRDNQFKVKIFVWNKGSLPEVLMKAIRESRDE